MNHVYTLPPKLSSVIKKIRPGSIFCVFASVASILIGKDDEYEKTEKAHMDSVSLFMKTNAYSLLLCYVLSPELALLICFLIKI